MTIEELKARLRKVVLEVFNKGNINAFDEIMAPDVIFHLPPNPDMNGLPVFKQHIAGLFQAYSERRYEINELIGEGDTTAHRYTMKMKHTGVHPISKMPPTGKELVLKSIIIAHWKNGKIVEAFENADLLGIFQQMGVIPPTGKK